MEEASAIGDLETVKIIFDRLLIPGGEGLPLNKRTFPGSVQVLEMSLCQAARHGHAEVFSYLLDQGVPITTYVMESVKDGQSTSIYQVLLDHGWDINSKCYWGTPSLCLCLANEDVVRWHLEHGADPNIFGRRRFTALDYAAHQHSFNVVKLLVDHGAEVRNRPVLHAAAADSVKFGGKAHPGRLEIMAFLLDRGADINLLEPDTDIDGRPVTFHTGTALHRAVQSEDPEHVRFLLRRGADRNIRGVTGMTPLEVAEMRHLDEIADILRNE